MNKAYVLLLPALLALLLSACGEYGDTETAANPLSPCTATGTVFEGIKPEAAQTIYHVTVGGIIEAHRQRAFNISTSQLQCDAVDYRGLMTPSGPLKELAAQLPPWKNPQTLATLSEADAGTVLLEYLRLYECALLEREFFLPVVVSDVRNEDSGDFLTKEEAEKRIIERELMTARPSLERSLLLLGGFDRLMPIAAETECVKRASYLLRNSLGLVAETMSCLPRAEDVRGTLLEPPKPPDYDEESSSGNNPLSTGQ